MFSVHLANGVFKSAWVVKKDVEEVVVLNMQFCQVCTQAVNMHTLYIYHTVPVAFSAEFKLVRKSALLLPEQLDIPVVTGESESGESV